MTRVVVVGTSGSGKTTLARSLAGRLGVPHVELDGLYWEADWQPAAPDVFRGRAAAATAADAWVLDGNYGVVREHVWSRADTIVWLDYPLPLILARLARRTLRRWWRQEVLWGGCRERLTRQFTADSIFWWAATTYRRRRRDYPPLLAERAGLGTAVFRFRRPAQTRRWADAVGAEGSGSAPTSWSATTV